MQRLCTVFICYLIFTISAAGRGIEVDSLLRILNKTQNASERADILNQLSSISFHTNIKDGLLYANKAYSEANRAGYQRGMRHALILRGFYFHDTGQYKEGFRLYREAAALNMPEDDLLAYDYLITGNLYRQLARYDSSMLYYNKGLQVLEHVKSDVYLAYAYKNIGRQLVLQWKNTEAEKYFRKALKIYEDQKDEQGIADIWLCMADVSRNYAKYELAAEYVDKSCRVGSQRQDEYLTVRCYIYQGQLKYNRGAYSEALEVFFQALKIMEKKEVPVVLQKIYYNIGEVYEALGQNDIGLKYFFEALAIAERLKIRHDAAEIMSSIAWVYKNQLKFSLAHDFIQRSLKLRMEIGNEHGVSNCYNVLGLISFQEKNYTLSLDYLQKGLAIRRRINHPEGISASIFNIALVYEEQGLYTQALVYQQQAMEIDEEIGNRYSIGVSYNGIGNLYTKLRKLDDAQRYLLRAQRTAEQIQSKPLLMNNSLYWSNYFEARNNPTEALKAYKRYAQLNDSIYNESSAGRLAELEALYQVERKDAEIVGLNQQREFQENKIRLQESRINRQNIIIGSVVLAIVLIALLAIKWYQYTQNMRTATHAIVEQKEEIQAQSEELTEANQSLLQLNAELQEKTKQIQQQSQELVETNSLITAINRDLDEIVTRRTAQLNEAYKELDTFFYRSSHDFRRPLTTFMGLAEVANVTVKDKAALDLFDKVRETARALDKMLIKLQSISDVGAQQLVYKEVPIAEIVANVQEDMRDEIAQRGIKILTDISMDSSLVSYPAMVRIIVENLVENSINFCTPLNPTVNITIYQEDDFCVFDIADNGQGIAPEYRERIFDMYFRASERSKGNGLGLFIVRKAVQKLNGTIVLDAAVRQGARFTVRLPMNYNDSVTGLRLKS
jgi:signal transduction histidine kinase